MTGTYTLSDKLREYAEHAVNLDELRPLMVRAASEIERLNAENEELIRGMTEMAERFTAAMDRAADSALALAARDLFAGGFVEAGIRAGNKHGPDQWTAEFEARTNAIKSALATTPDTEHGEQNGV